MESSNKSRFENINDLLKASLWPLIVIIVLITYHSDISDMFKNSSKVSLGSFTMEMQREAKNKGSEELSQIISELSVPGIKRLLSMGTSGSFGIVGVSRAYEGHSEGYTLSPDVSSWKELIKAGLVSETNLKIDELIKKFENLGAEESNIYYNDEGESSPMYDSKYPYEGKLYFIATNKLTENTKTELENSSVALTANGRKALDIIVETTARQIKKEN